MINVSYYTYEEWEQTAKMFAFAAGKAAPFDVRERKVAIVVSSFQFSYYVWNNVILQNKTIIV